MAAPIEAILIGAGQRGARDYASFALQHPELLKFVAVAEPINERRAWFASQHNLPPENIFTSWEPLLERPQMARAALVCTQDQQHTEPALAAMRSGYDVLLEKPMATTTGECRELVDTARRYKKQLHVCHVLRYTKHFQKMREIIRSGVLGQIINVSHRENVSWWHMAHSYVRGNWANRTRSSPMILAKCCHDFDILLWLLDEKCEQLSSFGSLMHFRRENAPEGAPDYCLDGCPAAADCPYYAPFVYVDLIPFWRSYSDSAPGFPRFAVQLHQRAPQLFNLLSTFLPILRKVSRYREWPRSVVAHDPTPENLIGALRKGPYGRCVYSCDNDVVDHQLVSMQFESGASVSLTMHGHSHIEGRSTRIEGSRASLQAFFGNGGAWIEVKEHLSDRHIRYDTSTPVAEGHGGGDHALMLAFVRSLQSEGSGALTLADQALESHLMAFAAERARLECRVVSREEFSSI